MRMIPVASNYGIIQFGLCLFHEVVVSDGAIVLEASPYNFYLVRQNMWLLNCEISD
jgi:hypothetical protein